MRRTPRIRKSVLAAAVAITAGVAIAVFALVGRMNSDRYVLACEAERAVPQQGRAFPPWGTRPLDGEAWIPLKITPETRCQPHETDDVLTLQRQYLAMLLEQASALLTARDVTKLDDAEALLKQSLLLTRPPESEPANLAKERNQRHDDVLRLLGDVTYGRASAKLRDAATALTDAAKQFDSAAAQHPRHASDASVWASHARKLAQEVHAGPAGVTAPPTSPSPAGASSTSPAALSPQPAERPTDHSNVPGGVALPVEPGSAAAAEPPTAPPAVAPPPVAAPPPVDAGPPTGGVLL